MGRGIFYTMIGYVSGSVLYAKVFGKLFCQKDVTEDTIDGNPGTTNAFLNGGIWCGICTLLCDLLKGILPVYAYMHGRGQISGLRLCWQHRLPDISSRYFIVFVEEKGLQFLSGCCLDSIHI